VNSRYQSKQKSAKPEAEAIFHLLNCSVGFQREHHEPIGQASISKRLPCRIVSAVTYGLLTSFKLPFWLPIRRDAGAGELFQDRPLNLKLVCL
jgi:hypothetical protein